MFLILFPWILIALFSGLALTKNVRKNGFKEKCGWYLSLLGVLILSLFSAKPISNLLVYSLEHQYRLPSKETLSHLDAIIILAGGVRSPNTLDSSAESSQATYSRLFNGVRIFKENNVNLLVLQGASRIDGESDAVVMSRLAEQLGVQRDRIIIEANSRNTLEHAIELKKIFPGPKKMRLGLVTSAMHMQRSEMVFKWQFPKDVIVPIPVDYRYSTLKYNIEDFVPSAEIFSTSNSALHEWLGIAWYLLRHKQMP